MTLRNIPDFGNLAEVGNPLLYPRRVLLQVLKNVFAQEYLSVESPAIPNPFRYIEASGGEVAKNSLIVIADTYADELAKTDMRPTIVVSRSDLEFREDAIDARGIGSAIPAAQTASGIRVAGASGRTKQDYQEMVTVPIGITCYGRRSVQVDELAWYTAAFIRFFRHEIRQGAKIHKITSPRISAPQAVRSDSQNDLFSVMISFVIFQTIRWVKSTTASHAALLDGLTNLSNHPFPVPGGQPMCVDTNISGLTEDQQTAWDNEE